MLLTEVHLTSLTSRHLRCENSLGQRRYRGMQWLFSSALSAPVSVQAQEAAHIIPTKHSSFHTDIHINTFKEITCTGIPATHDALASIVSKSLHSLRTSTALFIFSKASPLFCFYYHGATPWPHLTLQLRTGGI